MLTAPRQIIVTPLVVINLLLFDSISWASDVVPFETSNQSPFVAIFGLPTLGESKVQEKHDSLLSLRLDISNHFNDEGQGGEFLQIDGETYRLTLNFRRGFKTGFEWGVNVPFVSHDGGFLDSFIVNWHDFFNLPDNGRTVTARDQLNIRYQRDGDDRILVDSPANGTGDVSLYGAYQMIDGPDSGFQMALRASLKLPTGNSENLFGSGGTDLAVWLSASDSNKNHKNWHWYGGAGLLHLGSGDVLPELHRDFVWFGNFGFSWHAFSRLELKVQMDLHTPFYDDTQMYGLSSYGAQFVLGGTIKISKSMNLDLALSEDDLNERVSPDVTFHMNLRSQF